MGVVSRRRVWLVGVVVRRYNYIIIIILPHIIYPYSSCICSFLQQHPYFLFFFCFRSCSSIILFVIKFYVLKKKFHTV